jgi:hypothetical protein
LDDLISFQRIFVFFQEVCLGGISLTNKHLLLDGHNSHVALEAIEQAHAFGLNMVTLPTHTFHALQPFDVSCFKKQSLGRKKMLQCPRALHEA